MLAMNTTERLAIAAHLHVLLRRRTGRVTDPEWMATNREYASAIVRFAKAKSIELSADDLDLWAGKLESAMAQPDPRPAVPLVQSTVAAIRQSRSGGAGSNGEERELPIQEDPSLPPAPAPAADMDALSPVLPNSQFAETGFGESVVNGRRVDKKGKDEPRYVGGLR